MNRKLEQILSVLEQCCAHFTFPMLDNGYIYLAATRLSLYRSETDWGMVIEVFGYSPRAGLPDTHIHTFASALHSRDSRDKYKKPRGVEACRFLAEVEREQVLATSQENGASASCLAWTKCCNWRTGTTPTS